MNKEEAPTQTEQRSKLNDFLETVKSYLKSEKQKYPMVFSFSQKVLIPKISKESFNSVQVVCWFETKSGKSELYFKNQAGSSTKHKITELPYERCNRVEYHEDFSEELPSINIFPSIEHFQLEFAKILDKEKKKVKIDFPYPVFIPSLDIEPQKTFTVYANINPLSDDSGKSWNNRICIFADKASQIFQDISIIPYNSCLQLRCL